MGDHANASVTLGFYPGLKRAADGLMYVMYGIVHISTLKFGCDIFESRVFGSGATCRRFRYGGFEQLATGDWVWVAKRRMVPLGGKVHFAH
jgi:hypothetical protein